MGTRSISDLRKAIFGSSASELAVFSSANAAGLTERERLRNALIEKAFRPAGAIAETVDRRSSTIANNAPLLSGRLAMVAIGLLKGDVINNINFLSGTTALATGTNQWAGIFDKNRNKLAISNDGLATAWAANTFKQFALATPYTVPETDLYYLGLMIAATTVPSICGIGNAATPGAVMLGVAPIIAGTSSTGLTTPASCPNQAAALTAIANIPYAYVA